MSYFKKLILDQFSYHITKKSQVTPLEFNEILEKIGTLDEAIFSYSESKHYSNSHLFNDSNDHDNLAVLIYYKCKLVGYGFVKITRLEIDQKNILAFQAFGGMLDEYVGNNIAFFAGIESCFKILKESRLPTYFIFFTCNPKFYSLMSKCFLGLYPTPKQSNLLHQCFWWSHCRHFGERQFCQTELWDLE